MQYSFVSILALILLLAFSDSLALPLGRRGGISITLESDQAFCSFLPPHPGNDVGATEENGIPFCTNTSLGGQVFPNGFVQSAHFVKEDDYVQVTGRMNPDAYQLSHSDGGGQYDNRDINGVTCNGYKYWVNMLEPDNGQYCIRCCKSQSSCNLGQSEFGCQTIIPGDYN
ncbi:hypothetical protein BC941DRAFT_408191 [Chlamydoabsidia padenii]|nr:hypothetical protein BC941DRAFT_408191 [Chlamydoabsidia padenii]